MRLHASSTGGVLGWKVYILSNAVARCGPGTTWAIHVPTQGLAIAGAVRVELVGHLHCARTKKRSPPYMHTHTQTLRAVFPAMKS